MPIFFWYQLLRTSMYLQCMVPSSLQKLEFKSWLFHLPNSGLMFGYLVFKSGLWCWCAYGIFIVLKVYHDDWCATILETISSHTSCGQNFMHEKGRHSDLYGFDIKMMVKSNAIENNFKSWGLFRINQLISAAKPVLFVWIWHYVLPSFLWQNH